MAVPGKVDSPLSRGAHQLIKQGAKLIESVEDVMETLGFIGKQLHDYATASAAKASEKIEAPLFDTGQLNLTDTQRRIYDYLGKEPAHVERIVAGTNSAPGDVNADLISLQLKGLVKQLPGSLFLRK